MKTVSMNEALNLVKEAGSYPREERLKLQKDRLRELVEYARENSPYIKDKYKDLPEDYELTDIPFSNKKEIMEHFDEWVTDREVNLESVKQYLDSEDRFKKQYLDKYSALTTSGSTGNPFIMTRDSYHNTIHGALMATRLMKESSNILDLSQNRIACLIYPDPHNSSYSSLLRTREAQKDYADNIIAISPLLSGEEIVRRLNEFNPDVLTCYPSILFQIADEKSKGNLKINIKAIFCSAETLTEEMYTVFRDTFKCPVYNNYCSTEGGEAAMASECSHLHINEDWVIIEPINEKGEVISSEEEWSKGILVTDLSNYIQPVIRYRMEDCVRIHKDCYCKNNLPYLEIAGRDTGLTDFAGKSIRLINLFFEIESQLGDFRAQFIKTASNKFEIRSSISEPERKKEYLKKVAVIVKELLDREGCEDYEIVLSLEKPKRNERGGKMPNFILK